MYLGKKKINPKESKEIMKELLEGSKTTPEEYKKMKEILKQAQENSKFIQKKKK